MFNAHAIGHELQPITLASAGRKIFDYLMLHELLQVQWRAVLLQILTTGAGNLGQTAQWPGHQCFIQCRAGTQHAVHAFADQIDRPVTHADLQTDLRIAPAEFRQRRDDDHTAQTDRQIDTQQPLGLGPGRRERCLGIVQIGQQDDAALVIGLAVRGGTDLTRRPLQKLYAQMRFQLFDQDRHRGTRHVQTLGCSGKTAQFDDTGEHAHGVESIHDDRQPEGG